jgi:hypothetical protein
MRSRSNGTYESFERTITIRIARSRPALKGVKTADPGLAPNTGFEAAPVRASQFRTEGPGIPPVREKLGVEESAAIRAQLIREIETLPEDDLQPRAIAKTACQRMTQNLSRTPPPPGSPCNAVTGGFNDG